MDNILQKIIAEKKFEVKRLKEQPIADSARVPLSLKAALLDQKDLAVIAEIKRHSPSKGALNEKVDPVSQAEIYQSAGAAAISVLTDQPFFKGDFDDIRKIRGSITIPILCKDFIIDRIQIEKAKSVGADAILLIAAALPKEELDVLFQFAKEKSLDVLVEVHDEAELKTAIELGADLIGINNRNLANFEINLETTISLAADVPDNIVLISESGISSARDAEQVERAGAKAILVGEVLMSSRDAEATLKELALRGTGSRQ